MFHVVHENEILNNGQQPLKREMQQQGTRLEQEELKVKRKYNAVFSFPCHCFLLNVTYVNA